ncbi:hypothetical protein [Pseudomonas phage vB_PsaM_M1]|nr:hypothetical protein [Pseudomonas phage vB_PsaM_M1]
MQNIKPNKMQANAQSIPAWQYEQEVKQARKADRMLRSARKGRKNIWQSGE